jgi:flagellar biogenesis protein FliO
MRRYGSEPTSFPDARGVPNGAQSVLSRGLVGFVLAFLLGCWRRLGQRGVATVRLALVERIAIGPRQTIALIEADGLRLLVGTSAESAPVFFALNAAATGLKDDHDPLQHPPSSGPVAVPRYSVPLRGDRATSRPEPKRTDRNRRGRDA